MTYDFHFPGTVHIADYIMELHPPKSISEGVVAQKCGVTNMPCTHGNMKYGEFDCCSCFSVIFLFCRKNRPIYTNK